MKGQFVIAAAVIVSILLVKMFEKIESRENIFPLNPLEVYYYLDLRNIPKDFERSCYLVLVYSNESYFGPIIKKLEIYRKVESYNGFTTIKDNPYIIIYEDISKGYNRILVCDEGKKIGAFWRNGSYIITKKYKISGNRIIFDNASIEFNFSLKDWGTIYLESDDEIFLPEVIFFFAPKVIKIYNLNSTAVPEGYKLFNNETEVYLLGKVEKINETYFNITKGILSFEDYNKSVKMLKQNFLVEVIPEFSKFEDFRFLCSSLGSSCEYLNESREVYGYYFVNQSYYLFKIGNTTLIKGIEKLTEYVGPHGIFSKDFSKKMRIFSKEFILSNCERIHGVYYPLERDIIGYLKKNLSGEFYFESYGSFYINSSEEIYEVYPESLKFKFKEFYGDKFIFYVNSSTTIEFPYFSKFYGNFTNLTEFYSCGETKIECNLCNVKIFDGPILTLSETISEKTYNFSKCYKIVCNPYCNVSSKELYFYPTDYGFCPPVPGNYLLLEINTSIEKVKDIIGSVNDSKEKIILSSRNSLIEDFGFLRLEVLGGEGIIFGGGYYRIKFRENGTIAGNCIYFEDFIVCGKFSRIDNSTYIFEIPPFPKVKFFDKISLNSNFEYTKVRVKSWGVEIE